MIRRNLGVAAAALGVGLAGALALPTAQAGAADPATPSAAQGSHLAVTSTPRATTYAAGHYVVVLKAPAATAFGGGRGYAATKASGSTPFKADSKAVKTYAKHLRASQDQKARSVGATASSHYTLALNGFSADLSAKAASTLAADKDVLLVQKDTARQLDTWQTPTFLGLDGPKGAWTTHGGEAKAGDGVVVGVIDTGIWPSTGSFKGRALSTTPKTKWDITMDGDGNTRMEKADGSVFRGKCEAGQAFTINLCNSKLIGARYYPDAYLANVDEADRPDSEYISPRDGGGHGSHTASTAAGNPVANVKVEGRKFGTIRGMAPAAKIAAYKVCFDDGDPDTGDCYTSSTLSAVDDAIGDGVDVINFSISGALDTVVDATELAFEGAAEAGIFVATSAGNSGPEESTVAHNSPWLTTVAAGTHVAFENTVVLGDGTKIVGASISDTPLSAKPLIYSVDAVVDGGDADDADICGPDTLDPAAVTGKIVICYRGVYDRVAKSAEVARAGGVGMILVNPSPNSLNADYHAVPTVHISDTDGDVLATYMEGADAPTAKFVVGNTTADQTPIPQVASFSSRGPALANDGGLLKPDITAPGQDVLAAVAPPSNSGRRFDLYSGTSMSSPHIAGLAAFMAGVHPGWTPMMVKSAMMTTSSKMKNANGGNETDVFAAGSGQVQPKKFFDPGLFVTSSARDWQGYLTGQGLDTGVDPIDPKALNIPSFADSQVTGDVTLTRTFLATEKGTWTPKAYLPGFTVTTSPAKIVSKRVGDLIDVDFTFTRVSAPVDSYAKGAITLHGPTSVRMPVAMKPVSVAAPTFLSATGATSSVTVPVTAGDTGSVDISTDGLASGDGYEDAIAVGDFYYDCWQATPGETKRAIFDVDSEDDTADLDLTVYSATDCDFGAIDGVAGTSATGSADERVVLTDPDHPVYITEVAGYAAGEAGDPIPFTNAFYDVGGSPDLGDLTATPNPLPVVAGEETSYDASWTGLATGRYFGLLGYSGSSATTLLQVDVP